MSEVRFQAAMYLRLSRDDEDIDGSTKSESDSISSQRELIRTFIHENADMELYDVYVDDGFTGSNFDRPDFKRMVEDMEAGNINCIIVKDLSRFGRDYIEAGKYIQKTFPKLGVRFIAITDQLDSLTTDTLESSIVVPVKNFINDSYCRDISAKVRSQQKVKRLNGEFIGPFAVYGYRKESGSKSRLTVDAYAAHVVRNIFRFKINGYSAAAISAKLNEFGILSPYEYKKSQGEQFKTGFTGSGISKWHGVAVKRILTNEVYLGHMIQGKREKVNYKVKKTICKPEQEWVKVEHTHEPIVSQDDFDIVKNLLKSDSRAVSGSDNGSLFTGLLFCAQCKEQMVRRVRSRRGQEKVFYICSTYNRGEGCTRHSISEEELKKVILRECTVYAAVFSDQASLSEVGRKAEVELEVLSEYEKEVKRLQRQRDVFFQLGSGLQEDLNRGVITEEDFEMLNRRYTEQKVWLEQSQKRQTLLMKRLFENGRKAKDRLQTFCGVSEDFEADRLMLASLIRRILVYDTNRLELLFDFCNECNDWQGVKREAFRGQEGAEKIE